MLRHEIGVFLDEFGLQQHVTVPTHENAGILDQIIISEEVEVSDPLVNFITSSDHGVVQFELLLKHKNLAIKKTSCRNWQNLTWKRLQKILLLQSTKIILKIFG